MEHVDVLRDYAGELAEVLEVLQRAVYGTGLELPQAVDELARAAIVDGRVAVEPVDVEDAFGIRLLVESLRTAEIGYAA